MPISGYDQSMPDQEKGITSGIRAVQELDAADLPELEADEVVISTHVSFEYARQRMERYRKEAERIYRKQEREGSPKAARKLNMSGKFGAGFSMLKPEATRGNPDVAKSYLNGLLARSRDKTNNIGGLLYTGCLAAQERKPCGTLWCGWLKLMGLEVFLQKLQLCLMLSLTFQSQLKNSLKKL